MATGGEDLSDEIFDFLCNTCTRENMNKKAIDYCRACSELFCERCLGEHNRMSALKDHRDKLIGKDDFKDMTKTRTQQTSTVPQSQDDSLFGCNNCVDAGSFRMGVDYCKECKIFLCDPCLRGHNKWTNHSNKMLGKNDFGKMVEARNPLSRSIRTSAPAQPGPSTSDQVHGRVASSTKSSVPSRSTSSRPKGGELHGARPKQQPVQPHPPSTSSGKQVDGAKPKQQPVKSLRPSTSSGKQQVDGAKLSGGKSVNEVDFTEKVKLRHQKDGKQCGVRGVCCLPDGGWLVADTDNKALKRLDASNNIVDRCELPDGLRDVCYIKEENTAAVATSNKTVEIISLGNKMRRQTSIETRHDCWGVAAIGGMLYVTANGGGEVYEYKLTDKRLQRTICPRDSQGQKRFSRTQYITVSEDGSRLFVTDASKGLLILDTRTGNVLHEVKIGGGAYGVCLGEDGGLFVAGLTTIIHLDRNGTTLGMVDTWEMMEELCPRHVSYHRNTARLAVSVWVPCDYMFVFHMK